MIPYQPRHRIPLEGACLQAFLLQCRFHVLTKVKRHRSDEVHRQFPAAVKSKEIILTKSPKFISQ